MLLHVRAASFPQPSALLSPALRQFFSPQCRNHKSQSILSHIFRREFQFHKLASTSFARVYSSFLKGTLMDHERRGNDLVLVSDLDLTMVDHSDPSHTSLLNFNYIWAANYAYDSLLVYSTGRSWQGYMELRQVAPLFTPQVLILSVGTEIRVGPSLEIDTSWQKELDDGWDRDIVAEEATKIPGLKFQKPTDQGPYKVSFKVDKGNAEAAQERLSSRLLERGLKFRLVYSSGIDLDVLPYKAGKGQALCYLLSKLAQPKCVLVCGDSGNDLDLFTIEGVHGVIVSNAQEELLQWYRLHGSTAKILLASQRCAEGIIEALKHFCLGPYFPPFDWSTSSHKSSLEDGAIPSPNAALKEVVEFKVFQVKWVHGQLPNEKEVFERLTGVIRKDAKFIHFRGFELSMVESIEELRRSHGSVRELSTYIWFDKVQAQRLHGGVFLVTWQSWEQSIGFDRRGYFATAILIAKAGTPNGVEWVHFHETLQKFD